MKNRPQTKMVGAGERRRNPKNCERSYNGFADHSPSPTLVIRVAAVSAAPSADYFRAILEPSGELLCAATRTPFLSACRALLERGHPPDTLAVMRHAGSENDCFRASLRRAARLTVAERADEIPRFSSWKPLPARAGSVWTPIAAQGGAP
jgi:hypothetical protein